MIPDPGSIIAATIANGATKSSVIDLAGGKVFALGFATMTGATMTFEAGHDPQDLTSFQEIVDETGIAYSIAVTDDKNVALDTSAMAIAPFRFIRLVSASAEGAERTVWVFTK